MSWLAWPFSKVLLADCTPSPDVQELEIIGAGLSRTGTVSLHTALTILGFGPCHHGAVHFFYPERSVAFTKALKGEPTDYRALMRGYRSIVGAPLCSLVPELLSTFPKAKAILTLRDTPEQWWTSMMATVPPMSFPLYRWSVYPIRYLGVWNQLVRTMLEERWDLLYGRGRRVGIENYTRHEAYIRLGTVVHVLGRAGAGDTLPEE
ncbi:hypothetical protein DACRYDRAFT_103728 [Dacryopinax primogenitus]|uniref:P-loop containing nucleoside triphosphate hydrolase protein n=1 Tax=Dacryopinax primogenitus (strain DJM 731) TaxID=1858805 RepID=M5GEA8_DACPD|nr:uncharacterized protein DACRYDRAFT_103728 [Dacryopinax primogenitus]EJU05232.1 hypothetical protein DACRYDRAFT_103728 [Dacryopinax primogenitus]